MSLYRLYGLPIFIAFLKTKIFFGHRDNVWSIALFQSFVCLLFVHVRAIMPNLAYLVLMEIDASASYLKDAQFKRNDVTFKDHDRNFQSKFKRCFYVNCYFKVTPSLL